MVIESKTFQMRDGIQLKAYFRETGAKTWIIATHGLGEHAQRHKYLFDLFSENFNVLIYDLRGHGESGGKKAYVSSFSDFSEDLDNLIKSLKSDYDMGSFILFGHSMGGLITANYMQNFVKEDSYPTKVFLSAPPAAGPGLMGDFFFYAPGLLSSSLCAIPASFPLGGFVDLNKLSHDGRVYKDYITDPLCSLKIHSKLLFEVVKAGKETFSRPLRIKCPLFCAYGSEDIVVNIPVLEKYFNEVDKSAQLKRIEGGYHELSNEVEKYKIPYFEFLKSSIQN